MGFTKSKYGGKIMAEEENVKHEDQEDETQSSHDPAIAPALTAGLGAVYLRNKLKTVQGEN